MHGERKELELLPISEKFITAGGYRGRMARQGGLSYDEVLEEVIQKNFLRMEPSSLKMILEETFETIIAGTLRDGRSRRLGDYLMVQLEVHGKFDGPGEQFDPAKHKLALKLRALKAFRRKPGRDDVSVYNRNAGPKVVISGLTSVGLDQPGVVAFGKDLVLTGENLQLLADTQLQPQDEVTVKYFTQLRRPYWITVSAEDVTVNETGTQMTIPWDLTIAQGIQANPETLDPAKTPPLAVMVGVRSRGGQATAKQQLHRGKAYFDTWLATHPEYAGDFSRLVWGKI